MITRRFPALASRNFRLFWSGQFLSLIGSWMQSTVLPYLAYRLTGQPFYLGLIGFASTIPALMFMLPAGVFIERLDKRKTVIVMQTILMLQAFGLAFLALNHQITIWHIIVLSFVAGIANSIEITARQAMIIELVGSRQVLPNAIALNSTIFNTARVIGPSLTAPFLLLLKDQGEGWAFFANGVSYLFVIIGLLMVNSHSQVHEREPGQTVLSDFMEGQHYVRKTPTILLLIMMVAVMAFFGFPYSQQIPVFARDVLKTASDNADMVATRNSVLVTAQGVGALIAAISLAMFSGIKQKGRLLVAGQLAFGAALIGLAFTRQIGLSVSMMILAGWGTVTQLALTNTLIQLIIPDELRGRVISIYFWAQQGAAPFGSLLVGWMAQSFGAPSAVLVGGVACLTVIFAVHSRQPMIRQAMVSESA